MADSLNNIVPHGKEYVKCNVDNIKYQTKPDQAEVRTGIVPRFRDPAREFYATPAQILERLRQGQTICEGYLHGGKDDKHWVSQRLFMLDIDNEPTRRGRVTTVDDAKEAFTAAGLDWCFWYYTFSHPNEDGTPRFRFCFVSHEEVTDPEACRKMKEGLRSLFGKEADKTTDLSRHMYGTTPDKEYEFREGVYIDTKILLDLYEQRCVAPPVVKSEAPLLPRETFEGDLDLGKALEEFPFENWVQEVYPGDYRKCGNGWKMKKGECPICGHNDCFVVKDWGYQCKSTASENERGNIISYLRTTENMDTRGAREYFKYHILGIDQKEERDAWRTHSFQKALAGLPLKSAEGSIVPFDNAERPSWIYDKVVDKKTGETVECVSCPKLYAWIRDNSHYFFVRDNARGGVNRFWYKDGYYQLVSDTELQGLIKLIIEAYNLTLVKNATITEVFGLLTRDITFAKEGTLNDDENIINFQNGVLHLDTMELRPHSHEYLCTTQIPCNWNPDALSTPVFDKYMADLTEGNKGTQKVLTQFAGVAVSNIKGYRMKKALFHVGKGDTGKSQLKALVERMLGRDNYTTVDLADLESRFGTSQIYNRRLAGSADMSYMTVSELKVFKKATGGDGLWSEFKGDNGFDFTYYGLLWFCCNQLPRFGGDNGQHVYDRIIVVESNNVIPVEQQDSFILDKMYAEREGIMVKFVNAAKEVMTNGYKYSIDEREVQRLERYQNENNTVFAFLNECTGPRGVGERGGLDFTDGVTTKAMYRFYVEWCKDNNKGFAERDRDFKAQVCEQYGLDPKKLPRTSANIFYPFTITRETMDDYGQRVGIMRFGVAAALATETK